MKLPNHLEEVEHLVTTTFHPKMLLYENANPEQLNRLLAQLQELTAAVRKQLKKTTLQFTSKKHKLLYVQQSQSEIIRLKSKLVDYIMPAQGCNLLEHENDLPLIKFYKQSLVLLYDLLSFLKEEFPQYFNFNEKVPDSYLHRMEATCIPRLLAVKEKLLQQQHDPVLINILINTISNLCSSNSCMPLTYNTARYLRILVDALENMEEHVPARLYYPPLLSLLIIFNVNTSAIKNYIVEFIHREISAAETTQGKLEVIITHYKEINQVPVRTGKELKPALSSVQVDTAAWLLIDRETLEKQQSLGIIAPVHFDDNKPAKISGSRKIKTTFLVEELAAFFTLQMEAKIILNSDNKEIAELVTGTYSSRFSSNPSLEYFINSMGDKLTGIKTLNSLEDKLMTIINHLRKKRTRLGNE